MMDRLIELKPAAIADLPSGGIRDDLGDIAELAASLALHGVLEPLLVYWDGCKFVLAAGYRRRAAAVAAGLSAVPCRVLQITPAQALEIMVVENVHRQTMNPIEEARAIQRLMDEQGLSQGAVAERLGMSRAYVCEMLPLLELPDQMRTEVAAGRIAKRTAVEYLRHVKHEPASARAEAAAAIVQQKPSARQIRRSIRPESFRTATQTVKVHPKVLSKLLGVCQGLVELEERRLQECARVGRESVAPDFKWYLNLVKRAKAAVEAMSDKDSFGQTI